MVLVLVWSWGSLRSQNFGVCLCLGCGVGGGGCVAVGFGLTDAGACSLCLNFSYSGKVVFRLSWSLLLSIPLGIIVGLGVALRMCWPLSSLGVGLSLASP